jgi:hypothetical protein
VIVSRAQLEASLAALSAEVAEPRAGLHGPGSPSWQLERDAAIFLGGGRAALLQLAHPFVAYGVHEHSRTRDDVVGRFRRTFTHVFAMAFGPLDDAVTSARRVHALHGRVVGVLGEDAGRFPRGTPYAGNDLDALTWVWATLVDSVATVYAALGQPLAPALADAYYQGSTRFARLFGIPRAHLPADWPGFRAFVDATVGSSTLTVTAPARELAGFLFGGALGGTARPGDDRAPAAVGARAVRPAVGTARASRRRRRARGRAGRAGDHARARPGTCRPTRTLRGACAACRRAAGVVWSTPACRRWPGEPPRSPLVPSALRRERVALDRERDREAALDRHRRRGPRPARDRGPRRRTRRGAGRSGRRRRDRSWRGAAGRDRRGPPAR